MGLSAYARRLQTLERLLQLRVRLPLRYRAQQVLRSLEPEIALLPSLLASRPGGVAVDVGANVGIYTYALARLGVRVHALEPQPSCCEVIQAWAAGSRLGGLVTVHNVAAGAEGGDAPPAQPEEPARPAPATPAPDMPEPVIAAPQMPEDEADDEEAGPEAETEAPAAETEMPEPDRPAAADTGQVVTPSPAMPAPALDLSLPPDLTDLQRLRRD